MKPRRRLTGKVDGLEAAHVVGSQFKDGGDTGGRQDFLQEVAGPQTPHQAGELALGRRCAHIPIDCAHHRGVGGAGAPWCTVNVVKLGQRGGWGGLVSVTQHYCSRGEANTTINQAHFR